MEFMKNSENGNEIVSIFIICFHYQLDRKMKEFRSTLAQLLNEHCSEEQQDKCQTKHKLT